MNAHSRLRAAEQVFELHPLPTRPLLKYPCEDSPLFVGDVVNVKFSLQTSGDIDRRGTVTEVYRYDRFKVECVDDAGETCKFSVPRELLRLVRRGDA